MTIELAQATYRYAGATRPAITEIDLDIAAGSRVGLAGANEAGKSTVCLVASGLAPGAVGGRLSGSVRVDGDETTSLPSHVLAQRCGVVFQNSTTQLTGTVPTVYEEVAFGLRNLGLPVAEIADRTAAALETFGIGALRLRDPLRLSGGQAQLVAIATIMALRPRHLVLDEPTSQLDPQGTHLVADALAALAEGSGGGLVVVEHKTDLLARLTGELALIDAGRIVDRGTTGAVLGEPRLQALGVAAPAALRLARELIGAGIPLDNTTLEALGLAASPGLVRGTASSTTVTSGTDLALELPEVIRRPGGANAPIDLDDVVFDYPGPVRALAGVSLHLEPGETVAIVGQNGSGKSTLVRHLNGLLRPTSGRVRIDGRDIRSTHVADLARRVGLAFQDPDRQIFAGLVRAEVAFGPRNLGLRGRELDEVVQASLDALGLGTEATTHPYDLGYSRRKLLSLASIVALRSPVLVLDEPTTGQDARGVAMVERLVGSLAGAGRTVVAITHDMRFAAENFGRVVAMRAGQIVLDGPPAEVFAETAWPVLASTYLEPPFASVVGSRLGLGSTPTAEALATALRPQAG